MDKARFKVRVAWCALHAFAEACARREKKQASRGVKRVPTGESSKDLHAR